MDIAVETTRASVALATQRLKDNMIRIAEENWLPEYVKMLRALIVAADTGMDYQLAYEIANEEGQQSTEHRRHEQKTEVQNVDIRSRF